MIQRKILITGASGFIGNNLVNHFINQQNHTIFGVGRKNNSLFSHNYEYIPIDLSVPGWTRYLPFHVDSVVHLAQSYRYREFPEGSKDMIQINIGATSEILEWCRYNNVKRFIFASTGNVYKPKNTKHIEHDICEPQNMYGVTKLAAEMIVKQYSDFFETIIIRLFGVYGPGQTKMIIPAMIDAVNTGKKISIAGGKGLFLNPIYIKDCLDIINKLVTTRNVFKNDIFNISGNQTITLLKIVLEIEQLLKKKANISFIEGRPFYLLGSNNKIKKLLKIKNFIPIELGLKMVVGDQN